MFLKYYVYAIVYLWVLYFSSDDDIIRREVSTDDICLQPPSGFSDSRELSEAECDRELKPRKLSVELSNLLER